MNALADLPTAAAAAAAPPSPTVVLQLTDLQPNPWNRKKYDATQFANLVRSIGQHGVMQPIMARPREGAAAGTPQYEIVAGERRWRASQEAGLSTIEAKVRPMSDLELLELLLTENTEREEMGALDEAACLAAMLRKPGELQGYASVDDLAAKIGRSRAYCYQRIKLLTLAEPVKAALREGQITANHALRIARLSTTEAQVSTLQACLQGWGGNLMSVRDLDAYIHRTYMLDLAQASFPIKSATLLPSAGSCTECPKRAGNSPDLFDDVKKGDTCTDASCYQAKEEAHRQAVKAQAEAEGKTVITGAAAKKVKPQEYGSLKGYLELEKTHYALGDKPLRKLLGKHPLEVILLEDPHTKVLVKVVEEEAAVKLLKERGVLKQSRMPTTTASHRQAEEKAKAEKAWRAEAAAACVAAAGGELPAEVRDRLVWQVAGLLWRELPHDTRERVTKLMGWPPLPSSWQSGPGKTAAEHFDALTAGQLQQYFVACMVAGDVAVNQYNMTVKPERLQAVAPQLGVDLAAVKEAHRAAQRQRVKGKVTQAKEAAADKAKGQPEQTPETALAAAVKKAKVTELKPTVKYRDPATGSTWSGRGLQPKWLKVALEAGAKLSDFAVDKPAKEAPRAFLSDAAVDVTSRLEG